MCRRNGAPPGTASLRVRLQRCHRRWYCWNRRRCPTGNNGASRQNDEKWQLCVNNDNNNNRPNSSRVSGARGDPVAHSELDDVSERKVGRRKNTKDRSAAGGSDRRRVVFGGGSSVEFAAARNKDDEAAAPEQATVPPSQSISNAIGTPAASAEGSMMAFEIRLQSYVSTASSMQSLGAVNRRAKLGRRSVVALASSTGLLLGYTWASRRSCRTRGIFTTASIHTMPPTRTWGGSRWR